MMSKKSISRMLALLVIAAISTTAVLRHQYMQKKEAAAAQAKKDKKKKAKSDPDKEASDEPAPPPKPVPKATVLSPAAKAHLAEKAFIAALRDVFHWRSIQPEDPGTNQVLLEKFSAIPCEDLPPDHKSAWQSLLQVWKSDSAKAMDPEIRAQSQRASETLNAMFKAHGDGDIVL